MVEVEPRSPTRPPPFVRQLRFFFLYFSFSRFLFAPLLEEAHALAPAVGPPEVAAAGRVVAAVVGAVVAGSHAANAGAPKKVDIRRASEQKIRSV